MYGQKNIKIGNSNCNYIVVYFKF